MHAAAKQKSSGSANGAYLALIETSGLGSLGLDHVFVHRQAKENQSRASPDKADEWRRSAERHINFAICKFALFAISVSILLVLRKGLRLPYEDPLYLFPVIILAAWVMWAVHDFLSVVMGTLLDSKYILNMSTDHWKALMSVQKFIVVTMLIVMSIIGWHFAWFMSKRRQ